MRWLVLFLVVANVAIFLWFSVNEAENVRSVDEGRLPRVSEIEMIDRQGASPVPEQSPPAARVADQPKIPESVPPVEATPDPGAEQCFGIGWFEEESHAQAYRREFVRQEAGVEFRGLTRKEESLEPFHWVIVPPLDSREAALERYRELVAMGVEAYVVPSGERQNAISLGLFRSRRSAEGVLQRRQQQNIDAILVMFPRNQISYALVFEGVPPRSFNDLSDASGQSEAGLQLIEFSACEGVATAEKNP
ncbi:hypothetical protein ACFOZ5_13540 [Marinobacter lacisalsi]|uniref:SPOR domain-containing protein n=1 Tax=Marinobacter lacisalsi TaxID=475979 RepID=A0ABV8QI34_9GAMM